MPIKITYPEGKQAGLLRRDIVCWGRRLLLLAAFVCGVVNIAAGGPGWALVCFWGLWVIWSFFISPDLVEYNRLRAWCRMVMRSCILFFVLDLLFALHLTVTVAPIVCFSGILVAGILFFTDFQRQKHNMMPMLTLAAFCLTYFAVKAALRALNWADITTGACAFVLLCACVAVLRRDFLREMQKRFHTR